MTARAHRPSGPEAGEPGASCWPVFPVSSSDAWTWILIGVGGFVVGQLLAGGIVRFVAGIRDQSSHLTAILKEAAPPDWVDVSELLGIWIGFIAAVMIASRVSGSGRPARDLGLRFKPVDLAVGPILGVAGQLLLVPLLYVPIRPFIHNFNQRLDQPGLKLTSGFHGNSVWLIGLLTSLVVPVVEELFFRGLLLQSLLRLLSGAGGVVGLGLAVLIDAVVFALAHAESLQIVGLAGFGLVLGATVIRTQRLGAAILAHGTFNLAAVISLVHSSGTVR